MIFWIYWAKYNYAIKINYFLTFFYLSTKKFKILRKTCICSLNYMLNTFYWHNVNMIGVREMGNKSSSLIGSSLTGLKIKRSKNKK